MRAYAAARERLVDFSRTYLRKPPSDPLTRFAALSRCVDDTLAHEEAPGEGTAAEAREDLLRRLDYLGGALRWDRRRLPAAAPAGGELCAVVRDLQRGVVAYLDALRPLLAAGRRRGPARSRKKRAVLAQRMFLAEKDGGGGRRAAVAGRARRGLRTLSGRAAAAGGGPHRRRRVHHGVPGRRRGPGGGRDGARDRGWTSWPSNAATCSTGTSTRCSRPWRRTPRGRRLLHRSAQRSEQEVPEQAGAADRSAADVLPRG